MAIDYSHVRPPLEVFALDGNLDRATGSIPYTSLIWKRRYTRPGEFQMAVPANIYETNWKYIYSDDRPELGIVQKVEFSDTSHTPDGIDTVTLSGFFLEVMLNNFVFLDESPEQQVIETEPPKKVSFTLSHLPDVYVDPVGELYYSNEAGDVVAVDNGEVMNSLDGLTKVDYDVCGRNPGWGTETGYRELTGSFYYKENGQDEKIHWVFGPEEGQNREYDIEFVDDRGNYFYRTETGKLHQACGVVETVPGVTPTYYPYTAKMRDWLNNVDGRRYKTVYVKGPWQRTDLMEPITEGDSVEMVMRWVQRFAGDNIIYVEPGFEGVTKMIDPSFQYLGDLLYSTLNEVGASFRLEYSFLDSVVCLVPYKGLDRTQDQGDQNVPWAVFSDTWGTIYDYSASEDTSNYKNTCHVLYDYDKPNAFDDTGWPVADFTSKPGDLLALPTGYGIAYTRNAGYNTERLAEGKEPDIETYLDLRDDKPACDQDWSRDIVDLPGVSGDEREQAIESAKKKFARPDGNTDDLKKMYEDYEKSLQGRGTTYLKENYPVVTNLDTGTVDTYGYMRDWDLGDLVELEVSTVGLAKQARITSVEEVYESGSSKISIEIGEEKLDTIKKAVLTAKGR